MKGLTHKRRHVFPSIAVTLLVPLLFLSACGPADPNVLTQHNNTARTGEYLAETQLNPGNVNPITFGQLYTRDVEGSIYAQPLYVHGVPTVNAGTKNMLFVATEANMVYAFDADNTDAAPGAGLIFSRRLQDTGPPEFLPNGMPKVCDETPSHIIGITSTPVIDAATNAMYVVARNAKDHQYYLHALDITDNLKDKHPPAQIAAVDPSGGAIAWALGLGLRFNPECERNRPGLLLLNGVVYLGFAGYSCDACSDRTSNNDVHGWILGYRTDDLALVAVFCTSPESNEAGVWQSGNGLVGVPGLPGQSDRIYFETGNGAGKFGDSFVKLETTDWPPGLIYDWSFQPLNAWFLNAGDTDLGSGGPVWLPGGILVGGGKQGRYYVMDRKTMRLTQDNPSDDGFQGFQAFTNTYNTFPLDSTLPNPFEGIPFPCPNYPNGPACDWGRKPEWGIYPFCYIPVVHYQDGEQCGPNIHAGPVYWSAANKQYGLLYQMAEKDYLKAFRYNKLTHPPHLDEAPFLTSSVRPVPGMPGGFSSLSANFDHDAILWTSMPLDNGQGKTVPGRLVAFDATTLRVLWQHDGGYCFSKFTPPTIADGKVYRATFARATDDDACGPDRMLGHAKVVVYGLLKKPWWKRLGLTWLSPNRTPIPPEASGRAAIEEEFRLVGAGLLKTPEGEATELQDAAGGWYQEYRGFVIGPTFSTASVRPVPNAGISTCSHPQAPARTPLKSSIYWSRKTGAHLVMGEIREFWLKEGGPKGTLGYPITDEQSTPDGLGRMSEFEHGQIWWYLNKGSFIQGKKHEEQRPKS